MYTYDEYRTSLFARKTKYTLTGIKFQMNGRFT